MLWILQMASVHAEAVETSAQEIPVLYSGLDEQATILRVSKSSKVPSQELVPKTLSDLSQQLPISVIEHSKTKQKALTINTCPGEAVSNVHIRTLTQKADNYLNYYELAKASATLKQAEDLVVCLKELFNATDIRHMYFLRGILEQNKGNNLASVRAFSSAIRIKPDMQWNEIYSPDAKPNFEQAKKAFAKLNSVPFDIQPRTAKSDIWVNGSPLLSSVEPTIFEGRNIVQIVGLDTQTYEIDVSPSADSLVLLAPSTIPSEGLQWVRTTEGQETLSALFPTMLPTDTPLYVQDRGQVWQTTIGTSTWTELQVPKSAELRLNAKELTARTIFWGSLATSVTYFGLAMNHYADGYGAYGKTESPKTWDDYQDNVQILETQRGYYRSDLIRMGVGLTVTAVAYRWAY